MKLALIALGFTLVVAPATQAATPSAQSPQMPRQAASPAPAPQTQPAKQTKQYDNPYEAYEAGAFDQALQGFLDYQLEKPNDPRLLLNIGNTHYQMNNFEEATKAFTQATVRGNKKERSEAHYNLGNTLYREGKLDKSIEAYERVLELNPDDQDAKFNIEYVRDEIRRRHEEQKKRQEEQKNQNQDQQQQKEQKKEQKQEQQDKEQNKEQEQQQQEQQEQQEQQQQEQEQNQKPQDSDQDGLSDEQEKNADNPTDPTNPDSDSDGVPDGQEDANGNGKVDPNETDPNKKDTDGDGVPDAAEEQHANKQDGNQGQASPKDGKKLSKEEAERYLQSLNDEKPVNPKHRRKSGQRRVQKDW